MICKYCNNEISEEAKFCPHCGKHVKEMSVAIKNEERSTAKEKDTNKNKRIVLVVAVVVLISIIAIGVLGFLIYTNRVNKQVETFSAYVETFKSVSNEYGLGTEEENYNELCQQAEVIIEEKAVKQIAKLTEKMELEKEQIIELNEKVKEYQEVCTLFQEKKSNYMMDKKAEKECKDIVEDLTKALEAFDAEESKKYSEELEEFEDELLEQNLELIEEIEKNINNFDASYLYDAESAILDTYKSKAKAEYEKTNYVNAYEIYEKCVAMQEDVFKDSNCYITLEQVDETNYPITKLYLKAIDYQTGNVVDYLDSSKFKLWENTKKGYKEKKIKKISLMNEVENLNIGMVADVSASMGSDMYVAEHAMYNLISNMQFDIGDRAALYSFADTVQREKYFTDNKNALKTAIYNLQPGNMTALNDALAFALSEIVVQDGAKCIIAFTDGIENYSNSSIEYVIYKAKQYHVPIYLIGIGDSVDSNALSRIAYETGGMYTSIYDAREMAYVYETIYREQKVRYVLEYTTTESLKAEEERTIFVKYDDGDSVIRMETRYCPADYKINGFIFHDSDSRYLTEAELDELTEAEVRIALNEIYARKGYIFQTAEDMKAHFNRMAWYKGTETDMNKVSKKFNKYEEKNVNLLVSYEIVNKLNGRVK